MVCKESLQAVKAVFSSSSLQLQEQLRELQRRERDQANWWDFLQCEIFGCVGLSSDSDS